MTIGTQQPLGARLPRKNKNGNKAQTFLYGNEWFTYSEIAERKKCSIQTIRNLMACGKTVEQIIND